MTSSRRAKIYEELKDRRRRGEVKDTKAIFETLTEIGARELKKNGVFLIPGFAKFVVVKKPGTKARKATKTSVGKEARLKAKPVREIVRAIPAESESNTKSLDAPRKKAPISGANKQRSVTLPEPLYVLEIRALADRVFGDEKKASAWLSRPNASLSGQKPAELLADELGAAVVRETLEQIDHGIFA
jgi:DNA-binding protein HU-beta